MKQKLLTVAEAADLKGVTRGAIYAAIKRNSLSSQRVLGRMGLKEAEVLAWTPTPNSGRRKGTPMSEEAKARISKTQRQRWASRAK